MIPANDLVPDFTVVTQPSETYAMRIEKGDVRGITDGLEAIKQAVYKILYTERYQWLIYSWNYGVELDDLFGRAIPFVYPEIERRITEALLQDDRITGVSDFVFENKKSAVSVTFTVTSTEGSFSAERAVNI